jgi:hypothetical protein
MSAHVDDLFGGISNNGYRFDLSDCRMSLLTRRRVGVISGHLEDQHRGERRTDVLPAILTIAVGLSGAVAPLATAVLGSVDADHALIATGLTTHSLPLLASRFFM